MLDNVANVGVTIDTQHCPRSFCDFLPNSFVNEDEDGSTDRARWAGKVIYYYYF